MKTRDFHVEETGLPLSKFYAKNRARCFRFVLIRRDDRRLSMRVMHAPLLGYRAESIREEINCCRHGSASDSWSFVYKVICTTQGFVMIRGSGFDR
jgi:hypothetical protein